MNANWASVHALAQPSGGAAPGEMPAGGEGVPTQGAPESGGQAGPPGMCGPQSSTSTILMMLGIFVIFYFLMIRPQQKKAKEHQQMLGGLQKGEEVVTNGGMIGRITGVADDTVTMEVSEKVRVRVLKSQIGGKYSKTVKAEKK